MDVQQFGIVEWIQLRVERTQQWRIDFGTAFRNHGSEREREEWREGEERESGERERERGAFQETAAPGRTRRSYSCGDPG